MFYSSAFNHPPAGVMPPNGNTPALTSPINSDSLLYQAKGGDAISNVFLNVNGTLSSNALAVFSNSIFNSTKIESFNSTNNPSITYPAEVCVNDSGDLYLCLALSTPTVTTTAATSVTQTTATVGGNVTAEGGAGVTARGVAYGASSNPTISGSRTVSGTGTGTFTASVSGLTPNTTYYIRAYSTNSIGTSYGANLSFTTSNFSYPNLTAGTITPISASTGNTTFSSTITNNGTASTGASTFTNLFQTRVSGIITPYEATGMSPVVAGGSATASKSFTWSVPGSYEIRVCADNNTSFVGTITESDEGDNCGPWTWITITNSATTPTLTTTAASLITQTTATAGGNITSDGGSPVTARGVVWSTSANPTIALTTKTSNGTGTGSFTSNLTGLTTNTTYYVRAYATNSVGTSYGSQVTFTTTTPVYPDLTASIPNYSSTLPGLINFSGTISNVGSAGTGSGTFTNLFQVSSSSSFSNPTNTAIAGMGTITALGSAPITTPNINFAVGTYYVRFCADNNASFVGTIVESAENNNCGPSRILGVAVAVVPPTVTTNSTSSITSTTATSGGGITSDGGNYITAKGVAYGTSANPTISGSHTTDGNSSGSFVSSLSGLIPNTTYYVRAYATNMSGTGYGNQVTFTTSAAALPSVTTTAVSAITQNTSTTGGTVTSAGAFPVTARGVVYGNSPNPTVPAWDHTINGTGTGTFTSNLTGLMSGITYYARAYATSSAGTSYGGQVIFTTKSTPLVTTATASAVTQTTATTGGNVTSDGGLTITARGVAYGTSANPTISGTHTVDGSGAGSFVSNLTGLSPNTMYYVRAYATNSLGTSYGSQIIFPTNNFFTLIVNKDGPGSSGNIISTPSGINCGSSCSANYLDSTSITLNIIPAAGSYISGASGCDSFGAAPGYGYCTVLMSSSRSITFHVFLL